MNDLRQVLIYCSLLLGCLFFSAGYSSVWATGVNLGGATASGASKKPGGNGGNGVQWTVTSCGSCAGVNAGVYSWNNSTNNTDEFCSYASEEDVFYVFYSIPVETQSLASNKRFRVDFSSFEIEAIDPSTGTELQGYTIKFGEPAESQLDANCQNCYIDANMEYIANSSSVLVKIPIEDNDLAGVQSSVFDLKITANATVYEDDWITSNWVLNQQTTASMDVIIDDIVFSEELGCQDLTIETEQPPSGRMGFSAQEQVTVDLYPNPSTGIFHVQLDLAEEQEVQAEVLDLQGRVVKRVFTQKSMEAGSHHETFKLSSMPSGMYILRLKYGTETKQLKLLKQ
ncbi:MAG: T9SS type A sorting domain-containing protein [Bacteroidota bacterium]